MAVFCFIFSVCGVCCVFSSFLDFSIGAIDCLERLVFEVTCYVSSGTLNPNHWLTQSLATAVIMSSTLCGAMNINYSIKIKEIRTKISFGLLITNVT